MSLQTGITTGSNRSLRSLGRAKARPLTKRYSDAARPNNVVRGVDFGERRVAPYNPSLERTRLHRYALLGIAILRMAQPREGVAHLALRYVP